MRRLPWLGQGPDPLVVRARLRRLAGLDGEVADPPAPPLDVAAPPASATPAPGRPGRGASRALAALALGALLVAGLLTWRSQGGELTPTLVNSGSTAGPASTGGAGPAPSGSPAAEVVVQVAGAVRRPGVLRLPAGARVADAIEAAGGVRNGRSTGALNLARRVVDGEQIVVGAKAGPPPLADGSPTAPTAPVVVDLNLADAAALDTLPGVGPVTAAAILAYRDAHGGFTSVEQLREVDGIGPKTYERLAPLVQVG